MLKRAMAVLLMVVSCAFAGEIVVSDVCPGGWAMSVDRDDQQNQYIVHVDKLTTGSSVKLSENSTGSWITHDISGAPASGVYSTETRWYGGATYFATDRQGVWSNESGAWQQVDVGLPQSFQGNLDVGDDGTLYTMTGGWSPVLHTRNTSTHEWTQEDIISQEQFGVMENMQADNTTVHMQSNGTICSAFSGSNPSVGWTVPNGYYAEKNTDGTWTMEQVVHRDMMASDSAGSSMRQASIQDAPTGDVCMAWVDGKLEGSTFDNYRRIMYAERYNGVWNVQEVEEIGDNVYGGIGAHDMAVINGKPMVVFTGHTEGVTDVVTSEWDYISGGDLILATGVNPHEVTTTVYPWESEEVTYGDETYEIIPDPYEATGMEYDWEYQIIDEAACSMNASIELIDGIPTITYQTINSPGTVRIAEIVPEPMTLSMVAFGAAFALHRRKRR